MCTYNGVRYLREQMDSIRNQTILINEVVIMDDCSTDGTISLIRDYIRQYELSCWKLIVNGINQGWKKNFRDGFALAAGEYIFPCDQDDIWHPDKCETMIRIMEENPQLELIASNYTMIYSDHDKGSRAYARQERKMKDDGSLEMPGIDPKWAYIIRPGCTYCFRKSLFDRIADQWDCRYAHDAILWRYGRIDHSMGLINKALMDFRRHGDNATSGVKRDKEDRIQTFNAYLCFHRIALEKVDKKEEVEVLKKGMAFLDERKLFFETGSLFAWLRLIRKYRAYYLSFSGWMGDLYFVLRGRLCGQKGGGLL